MLYIFSGLPGSGKTTLSSALARVRKAAHFRVDVVEQAMRDSGMNLEGPEGYRVCYAIASHNLGLGLDVIADTVNPIEITRQAWRHAAESQAAPYVEIEVVCSDEHEHRQRIETRAADLPGFVLPTWEEVRNRRYEGWDRDRLIVDTARQTVEQSFAALCDQLEQWQSRR